MGHLKRWLSMSALTLAVLITSSLAFPSQPVWAAEEGWLGIIIHLQQQELGVEIVDVEGNTPASKAGLKVGDIVLRFNDQPVKGGRDFISNMSAISPGTRVTIVILRDGNQQEVQATLGARPEHWKLLNRADTSARNGEWSAARSSIKKAIRLNPDAWYGHHALGLLYIQKRKWRKAISSLKEAIRLNPDNAALHIIIHF